MKFEATPEVSIRRDTLAHRWVILQGTHKSCAVKALSEMGEGPHRR